MTIYEELIDAVQHNGSYSINFYTKTLKINGKVKVDKGKYKGEYGVLLEKVKEHTEELFNDYYYSLPSERSQQKRCYFVAESFDNLTDEQLFVGKDRVMCQAMLEGYVLGLILLNCPFSEFDDDETHYFWQSSVNKKLIVFKSWFEHKEK